MRGQWTCEAIQSHHQDRQHNRRAQVLLIAPVMPSDGGNGLAMRAGFFLDAYAEIADVDLIVAPVAGCSEPSGFARKRARRIEVLKLFADSHYTLVASVADPQSRLEGFRRYGRPSLAAYVGSALTQVRALGAERHYDTVHIFRLYLVELALPWLEKKDPRAKLVVDCDENDVVTYQRIAAIERRAGHAIAARWAEAEAAGFARLAEHWLRQFDVVITASVPEARSFASFGAHPLTIANVVSRANRLPRRRRSAPTILFVGTLGYTPNFDAIMWFYARVFRRLQRALAYRLRLIIVGRRASAALARLGQQRGIEIWENAADVAKCYSAADLVIVPLRAGGGTRIKIIEAASYGVPIVTTSLGAEGTSFQNRADMLVADNAEAFLKACLLLLRNRSLSQRLARHARAKANRDYSRDSWQGRVANLVAPTEATGIESE
jgi:polysaccharide biosynthesis protein PslH